MFIGITISRGDLKHRFGLIFYADVHQSNLIHLLLVNVTHEIVFIIILTIT